MATEHYFDDPADLNRRLALIITSALAQAVTDRGMAIFVASGGTSPGGLYQELSAQDLDWARVCILPSDERWISSDHPASNEALLRRTLLQNKAKAARLIPLTSSDPTPEAGAEQVNAHLDQLVWPSDFTLLGMGLDGHVAGIIPGAVECSAAMNAGTDVRAIALRVPAGNRALLPTDLRMTLTLPALLSARRLGVLFLGDEKRTAFDRFMGQKSEVLLPIQAIMRQHRVPVHIFWAPDSKTGHA
jgi:6-phosphogluconolactonase